MHPLLNIATKIARLAGGVLSREFDRVAAYQSENQAITATLRTDLEAEIQDTIHQAYRDHDVVFPGYQTESTAETAWLIDILSGAENYARGIPHFAVCIAIQQQNKIEHALIYDPLLDETFVASRGQHAKLNNFRVRISETKELENSLLAGNQTVKLSNANFSSRQTGCNALMLAYVANGRYDGFIGNNLSEFEIAAGSLLIKTAGGMYSDLAGGNDHIEKRELLGANPKLFKALLLAKTKS